MVPLTYPPQSLLLASSHREQLLHQRGVPLLARQQCEADTTASTAGKPDSGTRYAVVTLVVACSPAGNLTEVASADLTSTASQLVEVVLPARSIETAKKPSF